MTTIRNKNLNVDGSEAFVWYFLSYGFVTVVGQSFIATGFKFLAFDITGSESFVSLIGSFSAIVFILFGAFSGVLVESTSRKFFGVAHLILFSFLSVSMLCLSWESPFALGVFILFLLLHEISLSFHRAANNAIFYELVGDNKISYWISRRSIFTTLAGITAFWLMSRIIESNTLKVTLSLYPVLLIMALSAFYLIQYTDKNKQYEYLTLRDWTSHLKKSVNLFFEVVYKDRILLFLMTFSFVKTLFIYWPMSTGALLKFGIASEIGRHDYLVVLGIIQLVNLVAYFLIGTKKTFSINSFLVGSLISGIGITLFSFATSFLLMVITLSSMYVGLVISQLSYNFLLRMHLPEIQRTQGMSFSVVPYYLADLFAGTIFASLLFWFETNTLLLTNGLILIVVCTLTLAFIGKNRCSIDYE